MDETSAFHDFTPAIYRLPNEIIVQIFLHYAENALPYRQSIRTQVSNMPVGWLSLMLVCRHWRDVALASPTLWRFIDATSNTSWMALLLARSVPATIDLAFGLHRFSLEEALAVLSPHASRLRSLKFARIPDAWRPAAVSLLRNSAGFPNLEVLDFPILPARASLKNVFEDIGLSSQRFPSLHSLFLHLTIAPQDPLLCARLRRLSLDNCICGPSLEQFLDVLASCTLLQDLTLIASLQHLQGDWLGSRTLLRDPMHLPNLRALILRGHSAPQTSRFLAYLYLSPAVAVDIAADVLDVGPTHDIYDVLPPAYAQTIPALATNTHLSVAPEFEVFALCSRNEEAVLSPEVILTLQGDSSNRGWWTRQSLPCAIRSLVRIFGSGPLRSLDVGGDIGSVEPDEWESVFRAFPRLESFRASAPGNMTCSLDGLFMGLRNASLTGISPACPHLKLVEIKAWSHEEKRFFDALVKCFQTRSEKGLLLQKLEVSLSSYSDSSETIITSDTRLQGRVAEHHVRHIFCKCI